MAFVTDTAGRGQHSFSPGELRSTGEAPRDGLALVWLLAAVGAIIFTLLGWARDSAYRAGFWDMGFFDQGIYLLTQPGRPVLVQSGFHVIADHASVILYLVSLLYRIYPSVLWLFALQGIALAGGAVLIWMLARDAGVGSRMALAIAGSWLVYPAVIMPNLHDFHPESLSIPAILGLVLCARRRRPILFALCLVLSLSTKEGISLTVAAVGIWLALLDRRVAYGVAAAVVAAIWFVIATHWLIPTVGQGHQFDSYRFLSYLGHSPGEIVRTMVTHPALVIKQLARPSTIVYLAILLGPVWWGLAPRHLAPLIGAIPCLAINLLSNQDTFRNGFYHYSMPVAPSVFLAVIAAVAAGAAWLKQPWKIGAWIGLVIVLGAAMRLRHSSEQGKLTASDIAERNKLVNMIGSNDGVLTTHQISAQLAHRRYLWHVFGSDDLLQQHEDRSKVDWVLLDFKEDSLTQLGDVGQRALSSYQHDPDFVSVYAANDLYLFHRIQPGSKPLR